MDYSLFAGFMHLGAGLSCGFTGLAAGYAIGVVGDAVRERCLQRNSLYSQNYDSVLEPMSMNPKSLSPWSLY